MCYCSTYILTIHNPLSIINKHENYFIYQLDNHHSHNNKNQPYKLHITIQQLIILQMLPKKWIQEYYHLGGIA